MKQYDKKMCQDFFLSVTAVKASPKKMHILVFFGIFLLKIPKYTNIDKVPLIFCHAFWLGATKPHANEVSQVSLGL